MLARIAIAPTHRLLDEEHNCSIVEGTQWWVRSIASWTVSSKRQRLARQTARVEHSTIGTGNFGTLCH
jgi:hypothetical protein